MSMRDHAFAIPSIETLRSLIASKDSALVEQLTAHQTEELKEEFGDGELDEDDQEDFDEMLDDFKDDVASMIMCDTPPDVEPGVWNYLFQKIISLRIPEAIDDLPINEGYKHFYVWEPYLEDLAGSLSPESITLLKHLDESRPLRGTSIDPDGTQFSWLTSAEVERLHNEIAVADTSQLREDLVEFHSELKESLSITAQKQFELLLVSH